MPFKTFFLCYFIVVTRGKIYKSVKEGDIMAKNVRIRTSLGEAELKADDEVEVFVDGNVSLVKKASEIGKGDRVLVPNDRINVDPEKVLALLERNPIYRHARSKIFHVWGPGRKVTLLRKLLLEGLIEKGSLEDSAELRKAIVLDGIDLGRAELIQARRALESILTENGKPPAKSTVIHWLDNTTVLPYSTHRTPLIAVNPELETFSDEDESEGSRYKAWSFWRSCREVLMTRLRHERKNGNDNGNGRNRCQKRRKLSMVVDDIVDDVAQTYDENTSIATVVSSERGNGKRQVGDGDIRRRGSGQPISPTELMQDNQILYSYYIPALAAYLRKREVPEDRICTIESEIIKRFVEFSGKTLPEGVDGGSDEYEVDEETVNTAMKDLMENIPDKLVGLPNGTTRKLLSLSARFLAATPRDIGMWYQTDKEMKRAAQELKGLIETSSAAGLTDTATFVHEKERLEKELKAKGRYIEKLEGRIKEKYRIDTKNIWKKATGWQIADAYDRSLFDEKDPEKIKARLLKLAKREKRIMYTRGEIANSLRRYGLEFMVDFNPFNVMLDDEESARRCGYSAGKEKVIVRHMPNKEWMQRASEGHTDLVRFIMLNSDRIFEPVGWKLIKSEYGFSGQWARADLVYEHPEGIQKGVLAVEVKQHATSREGFDNALKAVEQVTGYRAALQADFSYCPVTRNMNVPVMGVLIAHEIDDNAKRALEESGCAYLEIPKDKVRLCREVEESHK